MKNSKATTAAVCSAILGGLCLFQFAAASGYSPAVPFQNKEAPSQIIGGVYIPAHEEPVMIQPGSVPFGTHKTSVVTNDVPDQSALNKLASQAENPQAEVALRSLEHKHRIIRNKVIIIPEKKQPHSLRILMRLGGGSAKGSANITSNFPTTPGLQSATPVFLLKQGDPIRTDLQKWAKQSGWTVVWHVPKDWIIPHNTTYYGNFQTAVSQVVKNLSSPPNNANIHIMVSSAKSCKTVHGKIVTCGNNTVIISGAG